ncbi:hypothetical protein AQUCO_05000006v1 [Aquilegia coerulea]|uniref:NB-ARC domain-containing protein n=1 Tax=Aquilegia coerulea TaxID=218851 RepID=A0A2G5CJ79_AQUCA|nr:hypothetical protein AQUCO_05000006v1 [Aquilegia coerulea]
MNPMIGIIGICGIGGAGKTTIMMNVYAQLVVDKGAYDKIIWVIVSKHMNLDDVHDELAQQLHVSLPMHRSEWHRSSMLFETNSKNGWKIVLTTHSIEVCCGMSDMIINVLCLSEQQAWDLFAFKTDNQTKIHGSASDSIIWVGCLSDQEAWDLFASKTGNQFLATDIRPIAHEVLRGMSLSSSPHCPSRSCSKGMQECHNVAEGIGCSKNFIHNVKDMVPQKYEGFKILTKLKDVGMFQVFKHHLRMHIMFRELAIDILKDRPGYRVEAGSGLKLLRTDREWEKARKISLMREIN